MNCVDLIEQLISIESISHNSSNNAITYCYEYLKSNKLSPNLIENNEFKMLICEIGTGEKKLILNGHVDVVKGSKSQFIPYIKDGKLFGRGSADMKAGVAAMMNTLVKLKDSNLPYTLQLQLVSDEETGGENCSKYLVENNYLGDFVICGEPTNLSIGIQAKGMLQIDIEVHGISAHGSTPWKGINSITKAINLYNEILKLEFANEKSEMYDNPSINLSKISGGNEYNKVPQTCTISLDIRFLPTQNSEDILSQINNICESKTNVHLIGSPVRTEINNKYVNLLSSSILNITNNQAKKFGQHGSSDARFYSEYKIPAVEFGPSGENWHSDNEYVEIISVYQYENILIDFALNFSKYC